MNLSPQVIGAVGRHINVRTKQTVLQAPVSDAGLDADNLRRWSTDSTRDTNANRRIISNRFLMSSWRNATATSLVCGQTRHYAVDWNLVEPVSANCFRVVLVTVLGFKI